jgi:hypothetical protein
LLATPLTVCVVVIGRHVPSLEFLGVLLSDKPLWEPDRRLYKRLLGLDSEDAGQIAEEFLAGKSLERLFDEVFIPALTLVEEDRHDGNLDTAREKSIFLNLRLLVEDVASGDGASGMGGDFSGTKPADKGAALPENILRLAAANVICIPAHDEADEIAALMLARLLDKRGIKAKALSAGLADEAVLEQLNREKPQVACVVAVPPSGYMRARALCRRLRQQFPELKLVAAVLAECGEEEIEKRRPIVPANKLASSLRQTVIDVVSILPEQERPQERLAVASSG